MAIRGHPRFSRQESGCWEIVRGRWGKALMKVSRAVWPPAITQKQRQPNTETNANREKGEKRNRRIKNGYKGGSDGKERPVAPSGERRISATLTPARLSWFRNTGSGIYRTNSQPHRALRIKHQGIGPIVRKHPFATMSIVSGPGAPRAFT